MKRAIIISSLLCLCMGINAAWAGGQCLEIRNGYFWDPGEQAFFIPHGFAYQTFNPPVYATQTTNQLAYDLREMAAMHANSLRVEFTWSQVETNENQYDFSKTDFLVNKAAEQGLKLFVLIGYQYPPEWYSTNYPERMAIHWDPYTNSGEFGQSDILNYNHPEAMASYARYVSNVCARYAGSTAIGGWIVGNEFAYYDLWEPPATYTTHRFVGYDTNYSLPDYRAWLTNKYSGAISSLNDAWGTAYSAFDNVPMALYYPTNREQQAETQQSGYNDLIKWRKQSISRFLSAGAAAALQADTNHLITYAMVGGIFNGRDDNITCEDAAAIVDFCQEAGNPIDFWTINNYPWTATGNEMRSSDYGISKYREILDMPVMVSECGLSSNDGIFPETETRQAPAEASLPWEAIMSGAIGVHIFHWNDRNEFFSYDFPLDREAGFGIVHDNRTIKDPVFWNVLRAYRLMDEIDIGKLFGGSADPDNDIYVYWGTDGDLGYNRANQELAMNWAAIKRRGLQVGILNGDEYDNGAYTNGEVLFLPRSFQLNPSRLDALETHVINTGVHVFAEADLPGRFDEYHRCNPNWTSRMDSIFGLDISAAIPGWESGATYNEENDYSNVAVSVAAPFGPLTNNFNFDTWKIWHGISATSGSNLLTQTGNAGSQPAMPGLHVKEHGAGQGRAAVCTFAIGDIYPGTGNPAVHSWDVHNMLMEAVYETYFGLTPDMTLSGTNAAYVLPDYRLCTNGTTLISLLNMSADDASVTLTASNLLYGKKAENLTRGGVIAISAGSAVSVDLDGDEFALLYIYDSNGVTDQSLVDGSPEKIWVEDAPLRVWPRGDDYPVAIGYDTLGNSRNLKITFGRTGPDIPFGTSIFYSVTGQGVVTGSVPVPDANLEDPTYVSSMDGASYLFSACLESGGITNSKTETPVELFWAVRPVSLPSGISPSTTYDINVQWQDVPCYIPTNRPTPLHRADVWPAEMDNTLENYYVDLYLLNSNQQIVATSRVVTSQGSGSNVFSITTPSTLPDSPYSWRAELITAGSRHAYNLHESFEDRALGDQTVGGSGPYPWRLYGYGDGTEQYYDRGATDAFASDGTKSSFNVFQSHTDSAGWSGFYLEYTFDNLLTLTSALSTVSFSFDFMEENGLDGTLEMQVKDSGLGVISYSNTYSGSGWNTLSNTLDNFTGSIDTNAIRKLVVLFKMEQTNETYVGFFDSIRFQTDIAPYYALEDIMTYDMVDSFENRTPGEGQDHISPWSAWNYAENGGGHVFWATGVNEDPSEGDQGCFVIVDSTNPGGWSGFGMDRPFDEAWELTPEMAANGWLSYDFKETNVQTGSLIMKLEDSSGGGIECTTPYSGDSWMTFSNRLSNFTQSGVGPAFDSNSVSKIVLIMDTGTQTGTYYSAFDNIQLRGIDATLGISTGRLVYGMYLSMDDTPVTLTDTDNDGIADIYETHTGTYVDPSNTGTDPHDADSDNDGLRDGDEVIAGTDPNSDASVFEVDHLLQADASGFTISWFAQTGRVYSVHYLPDNLATNGNFLPLSTFTNISVAQEGFTNVVDSAATDAYRFYRIHVREP